MILRRNFSFVILSQVNWHEIDNIRQKIVNIDWLTCLVYLWSNVLAFQSKSMSDDHTIPKLISIGLRRRLWEEIYRGFKKKKERKNLRVLLSNVLCMKRYTYIPSCRSFGQIGWAAEMKAEILDIIVAPTFGQIILFLLARLFLDYSFCVRRLTKMYLVWTSRLIVQNTGEKQIATWQQ